jgi:ribosome biogenesis GTPase A
MPGITKSVQEVHLDKFIKLLDSPGVVFADAENEASAALRNSIKAEKLDDPGVYVCMCALLFIAQIVWVSKQASTERVTLVWYLQSSPTAI